MVVCMPRMQVYLPDDLYRLLKERGLPASELLQQAIRAEVERRDALEAVEAYLAELTDDVGAPSARQRAAADALARRIRTRPSSSRG